MKVWSFESHHGASELIIAETPEEAQEISRKVWKAYQGADAEEAEGVELAPLPDDEVIALHWSEESDPEYEQGAEPEHRNSDGDWGRSQTADEWAKELGPGLLAVEEFGGGVRNMGIYYRSGWKISRK